MIPATVEDDRETLAGEVLLAGPRATVPPGARLHYSRWHGIEIEVQGERLILIQQADSLAWEEPT